MSFFFLRGRPFGQPPSLAFFRAAAALARLVARPACAARTEPISAPHRGHLSLLIPFSMLITQRDGYYKQNSRHSARRDFNVPCGIQERCIGWVLLGLVSSERSRQLGRYSSLDSE